MNTRRKSESEVEDLFEMIMAKNFPKLMTDTKPQTQVAKKTPRRLSTHKISLKCVVVELEKSKNKEEIFKETRGGETPYIKEQG